MSKLMELVDALRRESSNATFDNIVGRNPYPAREREAAVLEQLSAAVQELERDAARYRYLRKHSPDAYWWSDESIDAAMEADNVPER